MRAAFGQDCLQKAKFASVLQPLVRRPNNPVGFTTYARPETSPVLFSIIVTITLLFELILASLMNGVNLAMLINETRRAAAKQSNEMRELKTPRGSIVFRRTMALPPIPE